jgi:hypothetical protein
VLQSCGSALLYGHRNGTEPLVGTEDERVPAAYIQQYVAVAAHHGEVHLELLPEAGHFEVIVPTTAAWAAVRHAVLALVDRA